jgi:hypothetical protein
MSRRLESLANLTVVVNFAVKNNPDRLILVRQRLVSGGQIDNAQSAMAEGGAIVDINARIVGTAVRKDVPHPQDALAIVRSKAVGRNDACDSAHVALALAERPFDARDPFAAEVRDWWLQAARCELTPSFVVTADRQSPTVSLANRWDAELTEGLECVG